MFLIIESPIIRVPHSLMLQICSQDVGGGRILVFTSLVIAVTGVEDTMAAMCDTHDNLMSRVPLGLAPCFCHRQVC